MRGVFLRLFLVSLISLSLARLPQAFEGVSDSHRLMKVYLRNSEEYAQMATEGIDVIKSMQDYVVVFATGEQISWLSENGFEMEEMDLSEVIDESVPVKANAGLYHTYAEVQSELNQIEQVHGSIAKIYVIGKSIKERDILAIKISDNPAVEEAEEPEVLYTGCHHAREWISVEIPMYLVNYLVNNYRVDPTITRLVDERETWIVPIVNPDGLQYSQTTFTMWRKNMRDNNNNNIFERAYDGVDLNRNYGYKWGYDDFGSSPYPEDETYRGKSPFSEPETQAIANLIAAHDFVFSIFYHSYGEVMIYPWGYTNLDTADDRLFTDVAAKMATTNGYQYGNAKDGLMYNTNGEATDWMYAYSGTLGYTFEIGTAFIPPEAQIEQIWLRNKNASLYLLEIADNPRQIYPTIKVYTDKMEYSLGDKMKVGINLRHSESAITVGIGVWVDLPNGGKHWIVKEPHVTVPEGFSYENPEWQSYVLPSLPPGMYSWHAMVVDASTLYVMSESKATWIFSTLGNAHDLLHRRHWDTDSISAWPRVCSHQSHDSQNSTNCRS